MSPRTRRRAAPVPTPPPLPPPPEFVQRVRTLTQVGPMPAGLVDAAALGLRQRRPVILVRDEAGHLSVVVLNHEGHLARWGAA